jgi:hypothetical protein
MSESAETQDRSLMFGHPEPKKWVRPTAPKERTHSAPAKNLCDGWLGFAGDSSSSSLNYSPKRLAPKQIKIDGIHASIKENPFLKNNH